MGCGACERFGIKPNPGMGSMGQRPLPALPIPKQVDPRTIYAVLGVSAAVIGLALWFWYTRKGGS